MTDDGRSDQASPPPGSAPGPEWVTRTPKPIELPPIDEAEAATKRPTRERGGGSTAWLVLILVLVAALVGSSPYWAPSLAALLPWGPRSATEALAELDQRQGDIARRQGVIDQHLARLEEQLRAAGAATGAVKDIDQRLAALEQRPGGEDPQRLAALQQDVQKLAAAHEETGERVAKIEARRNEAAGERGAEALLLALGQLRGQVQGSQPFAAELGAVEALGRAQPEVHDSLAPLAASAATGIPSLGALTQRFEREVAPGLMRAAPESDGWGDQVMHRLRSLVVVRRVGSNAADTGDPVEGGVARAEAALAAGDLAGAVKVVEPLPNVTAEPARSWLADARHRLAAEQGLARLTDHLTARLAAEDHAGRGPAPRSGTR
jgi:hypothetical protein